MDQTALFVQLNSLTNQVQDLIHQQNQDREEFEQNENRYKELLNRQNRQITPSQACISSHSSNNFSRVLFLTYLSNISLHTTPSTNESLPITAFSTFKMKVH